MRWPRLRQAAFSVRVSGFNSLLEMPPGGQLGFTLFRGRFQFSIGDAHPRYGNSLNAMETRFNSLLEMPERRRRSDHGGCGGFNSLLEMPAQNREQRGDEARNRFQFSIGDAAETPWL